jgi:hypothetical protein
MCAGSNSKFLDLTCRKERERKQCMQVAYHNYQSTTNSFIKNHHSAECIMQLIQVKTNNVLVTICLNTCSQT